MYIRIVSCIPAHPHHPGEREEGGNQECSSCQVFSLHNYVKQCCSTDIPSEGIIKEKNPSVKSRNSQEGIFFFFFNGKGGPPAKV